MICLTPHTLGWWDDFYAAAIALVRLPGTIREFSHARQPGLPGLEESRGRPYGVICHPALSLTEVALSRKVVQHRIEYPNTSFVTVSP